MSIITFWFNDSDNYVSVEAEKLCETGNFIKAYSEHNELVAMFDTKIIKGTYITESKK